MADRPAEDLENKAARVLNGVMVVILALAATVVFAWSAVHYFRPALAFLQQSPGAKWSDLMWFLQGVVLTFLTIRIAWRLARPAKRP